MLYNITEHSQGFSICFIIKNPLNSPRITFNFQNKFLIPKRTTVSSHALYSHRARYNKPIRILVIIVQIICLQWLNVAFHTTHRKGHESKLLVVHSKSGRCNFWGLLHYDDWRSPWWASRVGPQHDHGRSDTVMIGMNLNSYTTLAIFFHHFCFAFEHETTWTTRVLAVFDFYYRTQACNLTECENHENLNCPFRFLFEDFRLCLRYNNVNYGTWHVCKPLFGCSVAICWLRNSLSIKEKKLEKSHGKGRTWYNLADGVTALAKLYALYSHRARSFNQWQRTFIQNLL